MRDYLEHIQKLEAAKQKIKETEKDEYLLFTLCRLIDGEINLKTKIKEMEEEKEKRKAPVTTVSGEKVVLPESISKYKREFECEQEHDTVYAWEKKEEETDGSFNILCFVWLPFNGTSVSEKKYVRISLDFSRRVVEEKGMKVFKDQALYIKATYFWDEKSPYTIRGSSEKYIEETGKYAGELRRLLQLFQNQKKLKSFKPY